MATVTAVSSEMIDSKNGDGECERGGRKIKRRARHRKNGRREEERKTHTHTQEQQQKVTELSTEYTREEKGRKEGE